MEHVEPMEIDGPGRHGGVRQSQGLAQLRDETGTGSAISRLGLIFHTLVL